MAAEYLLPAGCEICEGGLRCLGPTTTALMPQADGTLRAWTRTIWTCRACGHRIAVAPYADTDHSANLGSETTWNRTHAKGLMRAVEGRLVEGSAILDIGCKTGDLLRNCFQGFRLFGIEPNRAAAAVAVEGGLEILAPTLEDLDLARHRGSFDAIFAFDLIEHVPDAALLLDSCRALLRPGGLLVMETGCASGLVPVLEGKRWYYLRFFEHVRAFSRASMELALQRSGFRRLRIQLQSHAASRFGHYWKRGILGLLANGIGLNKPSPDRDGPVFIPFLDHQLVLAETPE